MVMIPKPNKDHTKIKGLRPIVLPNTVGKLSDKVVADLLQRQTKLFHDLQYGSRKGRSATDALMILTTTAQKEIAAGSQATLLGKDIISAFNNVRKDKLMAMLEEKGLHQEARYCNDFLHPRSFQISWDSEERGKVTMADRTPQGSPLSPVLWLIYFGNTLLRAEERCKGTTLIARCSSTRLRSLPSPQQTTIRILLVSYVDDLNPLVVSRKTSIKDHNKIVHRVEEILEKEATKDHLH